MKQIILYLLVLLGLFSCNKNDYNIEGSKDNSIDYRSRNDSRYDQNTVDTKTGAHKAVSFAISKLNNQDPAFYNYLRNCLKAQEIENTTPKPNAVIKIVNDVLLYEIVKDPARKKKINDILKELTIFINEDDPVRKILEIDNLCSVYIPQDLIYSCDLTDQTVEGQNIEYPVIVSDYQVKKDYIFIAGELEEKIMDNFATCGFYIGTSIFNIIVNKENLETCDGMKLETMYGKELIDCDQVLAKINEKAIFPLSTTCVLINKYFDLFRIFNENCDQNNGGINTPPLSPPDPPPPGPLCQREEYLKKFSWSQSYLNQLNLTWGTFFQIDNQPCNGGEDVFSFHLAKSYHLNQVPQEPETDYIHKLRGEVLYPGQGKPIIKWKFIWWCLCYVPVIEFVKISPETVLNESLWKKQPFLYGISLNNKFLFSDATPADNHWYPDNQGSKVYMKVKEIDSKICTSETLQTFSIEIGGSIQFGVKDQ